ncbi:hypothetical protein GCK72_011289 [Caenorhabditis remanei]|uniref:RING-type domain-containing protein n=1 Tax=Caenorhabditis remanei TaxID=31234 RepID=A0A6A5H899_CAERE|nr:hypothetical protein GCK72_011289 [Caenorhabditis remanei]KAF1763024.1 hypothetical protein GCK72_011289 [Caenorhabditis remanei]
MITIVGRVVVEHCDVQRYSALKTEFSNQEEEEEDEDEEEYSGVEEPIMENERFKRKVLTSLGGIIVCILLEMIYYTLPVNYQTLQTYTLKVSILIFYIELLPIAWRFFTTFREMYRVSDIIQIWVCLILRNYLWRYFQESTTRCLFFVLSDFYFIWDDRVLMDRKVLVQNIVYVTVEESRSKFAIECSICRLDYCSDDIDRIPRILPQCGHTVCHGCAQNLLTHTNHIDCPFCRKYGFSIDVNTFQTNHAILEIIENEEKNNKNK